MELGICLASRPGDLDYVLEAERLGFTSVWAADSQMIWSDVYAVLALLADRTTTMRVGTGVAVAGTRPAPVTAAAIATINQLAPGRTFCGIGTGNTAMRIMGHPPMRLAEFEAYLEDLRPLLRGEEVELAWRGDTRPVRHLMPDDGFVAFDPPIPLHVSAFGPRSMRLAATHGDGVITSVPPTPSAVARVRDGLPGRETGFRLATLTTIVVLEPGEPVDSERSRRQCGAFAIAALHYAHDQWVQFGRQPGAHLRPMWDDYLELVSQTPPERRHLRIHEGHNCWVIPEEERFVTAELIERSCLVGTAEQLVDRLGALDDAGLDEVVILPPLAEKEAVVADVGQHVLPALALV